MNKKLISRTIVALPGLALVYFGFLYSSMPVFGFFIALPMWVCGGIWAAAALFGKAKTT